MISLGKVIVIGVVCFIVGEMCGVFCIALCSANRRNEASDEIQ